MSPVEHLYFGGNKAEGSTAGRSRRLGKEECCKLEAILLFLLYFPSFSSLSCPHPKVKNLHLSDSPIPYPFAHLLSGVPVELATTSDSAEGANPWVIQVVTMWDNNPIGPANKHRARE